MDGRTPKSTGGCVDVEEFKEVQWSEVMDGLQDETLNLVFNVMLDREPEKLLKDRSDVINGVCVCVDGDDDGETVNVDLVPMRRNKVLSAFD